MTNAFQEYTARRRRLSKPKGSWSGSHLFVSTWTSDEMKPCCDSVSPGHRNQFLYKHQKSAKHVAHLFGINPGKFCEYAKIRGNRETKRTRQETKTN